MKEKCYKSGGVLLLVFVLWIFKAESLYVTQVGLELMILP
jgi:hypothetical protein